MLLLVMLAAAEPSPPPLVPTEETLSELDAGPPLSPGGPRTEAARPTPSRRFAMTLVGALLGNAIGVGLWFAQLALLGAGCWVSCPGASAVMPVTGVGTMLGIAPIGAFIGNRAAGGQAPYWKVLLGSVAGAALGALLIGLFEGAGLFRGPTGGPMVALSFTLAVVQVAMGQVVATEVGATEP